MTRIRCLKALQLAVAIGLLVLVWLVYPGTLLIVTGGIGLAYVFASITAIRDSRVGIWAALALSAVTLAFSSWGVYRYLDNGFDYLAGNFAGRAGIYWPAYLFLLVALGAITILVLHALSWRWVRAPRWRIRAPRADDS